MQGRTLPLQISNTFLLSVHTDIFFSIAFKSNLSTRVAKFFLWTDYLDCNSDQFTCDPGASVYHPEEIFDIRKALVTASELTEGSDAALCLAT